MLGGTDGNFTQSIKYDSDDSGFATVVSGDHEISYTDVFEILENDEEDTSRHLFKVLKKIDRSCRLLVSYCMGVPAISGISEYHFFL